MLHSFTSHFVPLKSCQLHCDVRSTKWFKTVKNQNTTEGNRGRQKNKQNPIPPPSVAKVKKSLSRFFTKHTTIQHHAHNSGEDISAHRTVRARDSSCPRQSCPRTSSFGLPPKCFAKQQTLFSNFF